MVYFETNANIRQNQIKNIKNKLNEVLLEDFQVIIESNKIIFCTDDEITKR